MIKLFRSQAIELYHLVPHNRITGYVYVYMCVGGWGERQLKFLQLHPHMSIAYMAKGDGEGEE